MNLVFFPLDFQPKNVNYWKKKKEKKTATEIQSHPRTVLLLIHLKCFFLVSHRFAMETNVVRYAKIALQLPNKTVRDVALRCRWMTVSFLSVISSYMWPFVKFLTSMFATAKTCVFRS